MQSVSARRADGTIDTVQRAQVQAVVDAPRLEQIYWDEIRRVTLGLARFSRGAIRFVGIWPVVLRFGPLVGGRRAILGGLIASRAGGAIAWRADGEHASIEVEGFAPLFGGSFWRLELAFHDVVGRRFLARVAREVH
ncbi:MAG TPA: hypothetical protein VLK53_08565 [Gaiellaceae bacterium]|nr:hypothetical protein [Gaiellaceae bacterium]